MIPYTEMSEKGIPWHTSFIGQGMQHNYWLYCIVDRIMLENPQIKSIVEIGTGAGALTTVFGLWGIKRNIPVLTIDNVMRHDQTLLSKLGVTYLQEDEFGPEVEKAILNTIGNSPTWLFCDGGNKSREFNKFAPLLPKDSIISAHDLGVEFIEARHASPQVPHIVVPYRREWWMELNVQLAIYKKT